MQKNRKIFAARTVSSAAAAAAAAAAAKGISKKQLIFSKANALTQLLKKKSLKSSKKQKSYRKITICSLKNEKRAKIRAKKLKFRGLSMEWGGEICFWPNSVKT